ncbi:hypothetical protein SNE26_18220 [Mucilaginibacter sp. cycad4]|uniref:hypothetical protein n=1 Tax=Mucilaginibacter sp. cycad4 TaxID=3342096 RepID=UPI002AAC4C1E|nr:hypothetical protein [Mucilaginibacter gossypii]WPU97965.1 hypothetical protein SNE26_18220 [Mucilaginibacter gossypii]
MKKTFAIVMLITHMLNLLGYMALNQYFFNRSNKVIARQIARGKYDTRDLIEIKIGQNLPFIHDWDSYVNVSGQLQLEGVSYNYVKLRVTRDTLFIQCIPNYETTKLLNENVICAKKLHSKPISKRTHESSEKKLGSDAKYNCPKISYAFIKPAEPVQPPGTFIYINIPDAFVSVGGQPPEITLA